MKKSFFLLVAAVLLLTFVMWFKNYRETAPRRDGFVFGSARATEVTGLRVQYLRDSMCLVNADRGWLTAGDSFPVDTTRIRKVLKFLLALQTREKVSDSADAQSLWEYGLDPENAKRVQWAWAAGDSVDVLLGKTSSLDYSFTYWKWRDRPGVYRTPGSFIWDVSPRAADWKEKRFWTPFAPGDVRALAVDWRDSTGVLRHYKLERTSSGADGYRLMEPMMAAASRSAAETLFEKAAQFTADDFGLELDPNRITASQASLMSPSITIRIFLKNGTERTIRGGEIFREYQYTRHPYHANMVWVFKWRYDYFKKMPEDLGGP